MQRQVAEDVVRDAGGGDGGPKERRGEELGGWREREGPQPFDEGAREEEHGDAVEDLGRVQQGGVVEEGGHADEEEREVGRRGHQLPYPGRRGGASGGGERGEGVVDWDFVRASRCGW